MGKHTATPWRNIEWNNGRRIMAGIGTVITDIQFDPDNCSNDKCCGEEKANAEYIVRCVNSHEALVEACKAYIELYRMGKPELLSGLYSTITEALKQAEGV